MRTLPALLAVLPLLAGCNKNGGDCIDGLEGQIRCRSDANYPQATEICMDGDWELLQACDVTGGFTCSTCVAYDAGTPHACPACSAPNSVALCAVAAAIPSCP